MTDPSLPIIPAATAVLVRDHDARLEVLLLQRNSKLAFAGGAWVFPGGAVDSGDGGADADALEQARHAACREAMEEAGWSVSPAQLHWFAHWTTPDTMRKRFATWFFIADVSGERQQVDIDGSEITAARWVTPSQALQLHADKQIELLPPTFVTLQELAVHRDAASAMQMYRRREVRHFLPRVNIIGDTVCMLYPGDCGYDMQDAGQQGPQHRCVMEPTGWKYIRTID
jgi:8-oxo-dGTP pyrophosphatase MutT (NUDIX family)